MRKSGVITYGYTGYTNSFSPHNSCGAHRAKSLFPRPAIQYVDQVLEVDIFSGGKHHSAMDCFSADAYCRLEILYVCVLNISLDLTSY